ncbi:MAG: peptidase family protein [Bacteroidetes bacterium]|nr:peptidase family protein [Bacteroidota bacterium]
MKFLPLAFILLISASCSAQSSDSATLAHFFEAALTHNKAYSDLHDLCKQVGPRLSGSAGAAKAVTFAQQRMKDAGADSTWLQEVMVPHWVRGAKEEANFNSAALKIKQPVAVCALGGSIGTPAGGITAKVIEVKGLGQLQKLDPLDIMGKIVYYSEPFDPAIRETFEAYSKAVQQRWAGAMEAGRYGAVAVVVRSMAQHIDDYPHTGSMGYVDSVPKIPGVAISTKAAAQLSDALARDKDVTFYMKTSCDILPDVKSYNVIGEIKGTEHPEEIIVIGGHLDSWDLAEGAQDDGAGVVQAIEVLRLFKTLGIRPKKTIRAIAFMNEENGVKGGKKYAEWVKKGSEKHIAAIESDAGGFAPRGFSLEGDDALRARIQKNWKPLMDKFEIGDLDNQGSGADVHPLVGSCVLLAELHPDSQRYFDFHHSARDVFENVNDRELEMGAAAMASFVYLIDKYGLGK